MIVTVTNGHQKETERKSKDGFKQQTDWKSYSQLHGCCNRYSLCAWIEGGAVGAVGSEKYDAADLHEWRRSCSTSLDHCCYQWSNCSQGLDSWLLSYCCGNLSLLHWAGKKEGYGKREKGRETVSTKITTTGNANLLNSAAGKHWQLPARSVTCGGTNSSCVDLNISTPDLQDCSHTFFSC